MQETEATISTSRRSKRDRVADKRSFSISSFSVDSFSMYTSERGMYASGW
jgi:hypothetical protein